MSNLNHHNMKKIFSGIGLMTIAMAFLFTACSPVTLTSWTNPKETQKISKVAVWAMFNKLEYAKPFEQYAANLFNSKGLKSVEALSYINPDKKYELPTLEKIFDSIGADAILIVTYKGTDKTENYVPPSTTVYPDYYYNYYGYYSWGYPMYSPGYNVVTTGGYWTTTSVVNLRANLYANANNALLWTADITITDPNYVDEVSLQVASSIYTDWKNNGLIKFEPKK